MIDAWHQLVSHHSADREVIDRWGADMIARYAEPHRHYHTIEHVRALLPLVSGIDASLAVWFHDAIYDTARTDNEERSAELAAMALSELRVPSVPAEQIIRATPPPAPPRLANTRFPFLAPHL